MERRKGKKKMKKETLKLLVCPECKSKLKLAGKEYRLYKEKNGEIKESVLSCKCGKLYPIKNYIPRFVKTDTYVKNYSHFYQHIIGDRVFKINVRRPSYIKRLNLVEEDIKNKIVLDAGAGSGCNLYTLTKQKPKGPRTKN